MNERVPEPEVWIARLREIRHACVNGAPDIEADLVREAAHLLQSGPFFGIPTQLIDPAELAAMLACDAAESAVLSLLGPDTVFMLSRGEATHGLATVIVGAGGDESTVEASTLALALLAAYLDGLIMLIERAQAAMGKRSPRTGTDGN